MQKKEIKFLSAAKSNDFATVSKIFSKIDKARAKGKSKGYIDVDVQNVDGATVLHYAAKYGNIEIMKELLSRGAIIDAVDKNGWRPLSYASAHNKLEAVTHLIEWGSKINMANEDNSPIHIAAALGHRDIVNILMGKGADIHSQNQKHQTPVDVACENNHYGVVNILLSGSSKQIEEFSENSFKSVTRRSLSPSIMKTTTLPAAMSSNNIANMSPYWSDKAPDKMKQRTVGSQEQISSPGRYQLHTFNSHSAKKSESLNAIFLQDEETSQSTTKINDFGNIWSESINLNKKKRKEKDESEIILPYPSKFSTSEVLKIKSPLLSFKNNQFKDQYQLRKESSVQIGNDSPISEYKSSNDQNNVSENVNDVRDNKDKLIKYRKNRVYFPSHGVTDKIIRSSLPLQAHYSIQPSSPSLDVPSQNLSHQPKIKGKPPTFKQKMKQISVSGSITSRTSQPFTNQSNIKNSLNNSFYMNSISQDESKTGNYGNDSRKNDDAISCQKWIKTIGLITIWDTLVKEGFDGFLALSAATDEELLVLCNNRIDHLNVLKNELDSLSIPSMDQLIFSTDIQQTLTQLGLEEYASSFIQEGYFYICHLPKISENLMNQLGIIKIGHRRILIECLAAQLKHKLFNEEITMGKGSIPNLSQEVSKYSSMSPYNKFQVKDARNKCHSLPRFNFNNAEQTKKSPPPIPPRSCSILNETSTKNLTLDDILSESMCQDNLSPRKKDYYASNDLAEDLENLDDIVNMLTNLGRTLDCELNHN